MDWLLDFLLGAAQRQQELQQQIQLAQAQANETARLVLLQLQPILQAMLQRQEDFFLASVKINLILSGFVVFNLWVAWWHLARKISLLQQALQAKAPEGETQPARASILGL